VVIPAGSSQLEQIRVLAVDQTRVSTDEVIAPARIGLDPNRVSRVALPAPGRVAQVLVKMGDAVTRGQPLLLLASPDADAAVAGALQAEAGERQARAALVKAQADLDRTRELFEIKAVARKEVASAENDFAQAREAIEQARAAREQAARKLALLDLKPTEFGQRLVVRAPLAGKVLDIAVAEGEYRNDTAAPLMTVADLGTVWLSADVPESAIRLVRLGEPVEITLVAYPGETLHGRVARIADTLDPQTRTVRVHVELANPQGRFRPEMFGSVRMAGSTRSMPVLPTGAVIHARGRSVVFVEQSARHFEQREVVLGPRAGDQVAVAAGLRPGERVVVDGGMLLQAK